MKPSPLRSLATHLVGVAAGGALAYVLVAMPPQEDEAPPPKHRSTTLAAKYSPTVTLELERLIEDIEAERLATHPDPAPTIRELNLQAIEKQPQVDRENEKELQRLRTMAGTFVETKDLGPVLTNALGAADRDLTRALFLEWHRRDPAAAFDALAKRGAWMESFDDILTLAIPNDQIIAQLDRDDRPGSFQDHLAIRLGVKLAASDGLHGLTQALDGIRSQSALLLGFTERWIPDDGREAARFIGLEMKPGHQRQLLDALAGHGVSLNPQPWTDQFANALFDYDLHVPQETFERLVASVDRSKKTPYMYGRTPVSPLQSDTESSEAIDVLARLYHKRDYPELFAAGSISLDEIVDEITAEVPNAKHHPESLKRALFLELAPHNPARAVTWANATIPRADLDEDINSFLAMTVEIPMPAPPEVGSGNIWSEGYDPRTRRLADLAAVLQPSQMSDLDSSFFAPRILTQFEEWSRLAPDAAKQSIDRIAPGHAIWKFEFPRTVGP